MLAQTLCHIPKVSPNKERILWEKGIHSWASFRSITKNPSFLDDCEFHLSQRNPSFFAEHLKSDQHWRLFSEFQDSVAYVDIETTGLDKKYDKITTIALFDGKKVNTYVNGHNLDAFKEDIQKYNLLVTFNGKTFDVPFMRSFFGIDLPHAHIDLRYVMKRLGYSGGLKLVERQLGINRGDLKDVDGYFAVRLWHLFKSKGNKAALETLLAYNCADVINLEQLMVLAYNMNIKATPFFDLHQLKSPKTFEIPFNVDVQLVNRLNGNFVVH